MKLYDLNIITADKIITFSVQEPETDQEAGIGLSYLKNISDQQGMIYFSRHPEHLGHPCWDARMCTKDTKFAVDFIFVDSLGNIKKIDKNVPAFSSEIHTDINVVAVIELNAGVCDKFNICVGDSVIHQKLQISADNKIYFHNELFDKIVQSTFDKINKDNIVFFAIAEGGAMGWAGAIQIITKEPSGLNMFCIDSTGINDFKTVEKLFPPLKQSRLFFLEPSVQDENWTIVNMGFGNYLFVRKDYSDKFIKETEKFGSRGEIYQNWVKVAKKLLQQKHI